MIFTLLRRDPAVRVLPLMLLAYAVLGSMTARAQLESGPVAAPFENRQLAVNLLLITAWALINYFTVGKMHEIASPFEMAMPVDARTLWGVRVLAMIAAVGGGMVGFCVGFTLAYDAPIPSPQTALAFNVTAFALLIPCLYTSARIRTPAWGMPLPVFLPLLAAIGYACLWSGLRTFLPGLVVLGAGAVLVASTYVRMPASFELASTARPSEAYGFEWLSLEWLDGVTGIGRFLDQGRSLRPPAWFTQSQRHLLIALVLLLNVFALSLSPFVLVLVLVLVQFAWFARTVNGGSRLAPLPVSRDRVFLFATMPGLVVGAFTVAGLVAFLPELTWAQVFASKQAALGFAIYAFAWWFTLSLLLDTLATPPLTSAGRFRRRFLRAKYFWATALTLALVVLSALERGRNGEILYVWEASDSRAGLLVLADALPTGAAPLWGLALLASFAAFAALRRSFYRVELVPASDF